MLGRQTPPFWLHWTPGVTYSGYPVTVSSVLLYLATEEVWYASLLISRVMLVSADIV